MTSLTRSVLPVVAVLLAASVASLPSASLADSSWYGSLTGNRVHLQNSDNLAGGVASELEFDDGFGVDGAIGYALGNGLRIEGEAGYRKNDVDTLTVPLAGIFSLPANGEVELWTGFANVFYDIDLDSQVVPYIGGGLGVARYSLELNAAPLGGRLANDSDTVFAYHVSGGLSYAVTPAAVIFAGYRYLATQDPKIVPTTGGTVTTEYKSHNAQLGVRFMF